MTEKTAFTPTSLSPWLTLPNAAVAVTFYKEAFAAVETYRLETPEGLVVKLSVDGAEFWISGSADEEVSAAPNVTDGEPVRMILTVDDPDMLFAKALQAGAVEVFAVGEGHGWRLGRMIDPFGLHWEIGKPLL
ncbi:VOC family protein [Segetibacter aerophilus]|uniref:Glyoxalase-like domain-containing protein n=1 Tax=Segetibacter aerophilus TaxID=670293 RepID=A0A512BDI0_9BACT|nr:VOC family protein [Segetibacter aerophilus]GEO10021.1 hypothetical protein SAE01_25170 [Segetibacter aerophilus]